MNKSWQAPFEPNTECVHCGGNARIAFVVFEDFDKETEEKQYFVTDLHKNDPDGEGYWLHDCGAFATYLCEKCLEPTAQYNQA